MNGERVHIRLRPPDGEPLSGGFACGGFDTTGGCTSVLIPPPGVQHHYVHGYGLCLVCLYNVAKDGRAVVGMFTDGITLYALDTVLKPESAVAAGATFQRFS